MAEDLPFGAGKRGGSRVSILPTLAPLLAPSQVVPINMAKHEQRERGLIRRPLLQSQKRLKATGMKSDAEPTTSDSTADQQRRPETGPWSRVKDAMNVSSLQGYSNNLRLQRSTSAISRFRPT